jgi:hypothetical protein
MRRKTWGRPNSVLRARRNGEGDFDTIDQDEAAAIIGKSTKTLQRWRDREYAPSSWTVAT